MSAARIDDSVIESLTSGRIGVFDVPCPQCGPVCRAPANRRRPTLRIWRLQSEFATYHCARCGAHGHGRGSQTNPSDLGALTQLRANADARQRAAAESQRSKALWLWRHRHPVAGSIAETYLREVRRCCGTLPATLGFLPAHGEYPPAMIAAFGLAEEIEPGLVVIADDAVFGVHLTRLRADGTGKAGFGSDKIMIGNSHGYPIVVAPPNDLLGLAITEGIEDALSVSEATGLGTWAAGSASRLPNLADVVPDYIECVSVVADDDHTGRHHAAQLVRRLSDRAGLQIRTIVPRANRPAA
jgi:hypothetical protein